MASPPEPHEKVPSAFHHGVGDDRHPLATGLAVLVIALGVVSVVSVWFGSWEVGAWTGFAGGLVAAYDELISSTSGERWLILVGFVLCLVGLTVSMANGAIF
jgi:hypothetical protein